VEPIAREVEKLRGLDFEHAVPVDFLSEAAFKKHIAVDRDKLTAGDKRDLRRAQSQLRSIGLLGDGVDLIDSISSLRTSGALAQYDPSTKRATVRGKKLDAATKVTLAHELTHALQDQHFNLTKLQRAANRAHSSAALTALVEGDAVRIQQLYAAQLSSAERDEYERSLKSGADEARPQGVPDSLVVFIQSPYQLGPPMLAVVEAIKGEQAIDGLFRDPPRPDSAFLNPSTVVDGSKVAKVAQPALTADEQREGKPDVFGSFALFLMLAARSDPVAALAIADDWAGDAMVTFKRGDTTCIRATFAGRTADATSAMSEALRQWAASGPPGAASVQNDGSRPTLTTCDPGSASVAAAHDGSLAALTVALTRNEFLAALTKQGADIKVADCTASGIIASPAFRPLLDASVANPNATPDADAAQQFQQTVLAIAARCAK
jgi:hypothetical protein